MATTQSPGAYFARPMRPDALQRATSRIRAQLTAAGVPRGEAAAVAKGAVAAARHTRAYLDEVRALLKARGPAATVRALESLRRTTLHLRDLGGSLAGPLAQAKAAAGDGVDAASLLEVWYQGGGPEELSAEGRLRQGLAERLSSLCPVRVSDIAHLACLWSDAQRFHVALRHFLRPAAPVDAASFLEAISGFLPDHVLPVDLEGLPGDPGLLEGLPAMIERIGGRAR